MKTLDEVEAEIVELRKADNILVKCPTCDGTGDVHSHNPRCWDCGGTGRTTAKMAKEAQYRSDMIKKHLPAATGDYQ